MTDKVQKIREEVVSLFNHVKDSDFESDSGAFYYLKDLLDFIDSLQEEPVSDDLEEAAQEYVTKEGYLAGLHYNSMVRSFKAGAKWNASHKTKLPDNLLLAARKASIDMCDIDDRYLDEYPYNPIAEQKFIEGANWQKKQDQETIELAEDHAMLAGMEKMKEEMMAKAIDGDITFDYYGDDDKTYGCIAHDSFCLEDFGLKDRNKVKVIVIKKD